MATRHAAIPLLSRCGWAQVVLGDVIGDLPPIDNFSFAESQHYPKGKMDSPHQVHGASPPPPPHPPPRNPPPPLQYKGEGEMADDLSLAHAYKAKLQALQRN